MLCMRPDSMMTLLWAREPGQRAVAVRANAERWEDTREGADEAILSNELESEIFSMDFSAISGQLEIAWVWMSVWNEVSAKTDWMAWIVAVVSLVRGMAGCLDPLQDCDKP